MEKLKRTQQFAFFMQTGGASPAFYFKKRITRLYKLVIFTI